MRYCNFFSLHTKSSPKRFQLIHLLNAFILQLVIPIALSLVFKKSNTSFENNKKKYYLIRICKKKSIFLFKVTRSRIEKWQTLSKGPTLDDKQLILFRQSNVVWIFSILFVFLIIRILKKFQQAIFLKYYSFCILYVPNIFKPLPSPATWTKTYGKLSF